MKRKRPYLGDWWLGGDRLQREENADAEVEIVGGTDEFGEDGIYGHHLRDVVKRHRQLPLAEQRVQGRPLVGPVSEAERYRETMTQVLNVLGEGECPTNICEGCEVEREEARRLLKEALR